MASFDVFDTVLTRLVGSPTSLFLLLGRQAADRGLRVTPEAFARARVAAQARALRRHGERISTATIYAELAPALHLSDEGASALMAEEYALHSRLVRPVPSMAAVVDRARAEGERIVYLSDMDAPTSHVGALLREHDLLRDGDALYVSCDEACAKWSGGLFRLVLEAERILPSQMRHIGDHLLSDVGVPRRLGIGVEHHAEGNLNRYEEILESHTWATEGLSSVFAGTSRLVRLTVPAADDRERALRDVASSVVAPLVTGFVIWVLERARELGVDRLYFLSRDGQILMETAERLAPALGMEGKLCYLHVSNQAVNLASTGLSIDGLGWLCDVEGMNSPRSMAQRLGLAADDLLPVLEQLGMEGHLDDIALSAEQRQEVVRAVLETPELRLGIEQRVAGQRSMFLDYLHASGFTEAGRVGVVDMGWRGTSQHFLEELVSERPEVEVFGFYFGADPPIVPRYEPAHRDAYMFDLREGAGHGLGISDFPDVFRMSLEMFCCGDHGPVVGYERRDHVVHPVFKTKLNEPAMSWGLPVVRAALTAFRDLLPADEDYVNLNADVRAATADAFRAFLDSPAQSEAEAWSAHPLECDSVGLYTLPFGQPYEWRDFLPALRRDGLERHHRYSWHAGSLAITRADLRLLLVGLSRAKGLARRTVRRLRRLMPRRVALRRPLGNGSRRAAPTQH